MAVDNLIISLRNGLTNEKKAEFINFRFSKEVVEFIFVETFARIFLNIILGSIQRLIEIRMASV